LPTEVTELLAAVGGLIARTSPPALSSHSIFVGSVSTKSERAFLHAMAGCQGPPYPIAEVTSALGKSDQRSISVRRNSLIRKGLIYAPEHGAIDYTVPHFAAYLRGQDAE